MEILTYSYSAYHPPSDDLAISWHGSPFSVIYSLRLSLSTGQRPSLKTYIERSWDRSRKRLLLRSLCPPVKFGVDNYAELPYIVILLSQPKLYNLWCVATQYPFAPLNFDASRSCVCFKAFLTALIEEMFIVCTCKKIFSLRSLSWRPFKSYEVGGIWLKIRIQFSWGHCRCCLKPSSASKLRSFHHAQLLTYRVIHSPDILHVSPTHCSVNVFKSTNI